MITDNLIKEKLSRKEARELLSKIRKYGIPVMPFILRRSGNSIQDHFDGVRKNIQMYKEMNISGYALKREETVLRCWELYNQISDDDKAILFHWNKSWNDQKEIHKSYGKNSRPPRQDNKTYLNTSPSGYSSNKNKIRYPRKKRKTAWKRFYKLFPHLKPVEEEKS